jgi:ATP-binding protein involved in chromosome partitioning
MRVIGADIPALVPPRALKTHPNVCLGLLQHMPEVQRRVGIGQGRSHQYFSWGFAHEDQKSTNVGAQSTGFSRNSLCPGDRIAGSKGYTPASIRDKEFAVPRSHHVVAIASGKGGVGKSTVTTNLAVALNQQGFAVGLLDADIYGPSQQLMLGVPESTVPDQQDGEYLLPVEAHGLRTMSMGYLSSASTPMVWRGPMASSAMSQLLEKTAWGDLDVLLVDMPPGTGDIQLTLAQRATLAGAVIVSTPQDIALLDARKGIEMFQKVEVPVLGLIENMTAHVCSACGHVEALFGEEGGQQLADRYDVPLLGQIPLRRAIRECSDQGRPIVLAEPEGEVAAIYRGAAEQLMKALVEQEPQTTPIISMGD